MQLWDIYNSEDPRRESSSSDYPSPSKPNQRPEQEQETDQFNIHRANFFDSYYDFLKNYIRFHILAEFNWDDHAFSVL